MKKNVIVFGLIAGSIVTALMIFSMTKCYNSTDYDGSMALGYASMIIAFSFVFVGIKNYRDKYNDGVITFGKAFKTGLFITLIASTMYVVGWLIDYYCFIPDFMEKYSEHIINEAKKAGVGGVELDKKVAEMSKYKEMYKNPVFVILLTYSEIFPVGLIITLISAFILKQKSKYSDSAVTT